MLDVGLGPLTLGLRLQGAASQLAQNAVMVPNALLGGKGKNVRGAFGRISAQVWDWLLRIYEHARWHRIGLYQNP